MGFLEEVAEVLDRKIVLVAAGGTAMTLYGLKPSTIDVDFTGPAEDVRLFIKSVKRVQPGIRVDAWPNGQVFSQFLPSDYLSKSRRIRRVGKIELKALSPVDIVATKIGRLDERDLDDIKACVKRFRLGKNAIGRRARRVEYAGNRKVFDDNLETVLRQLADMRKPT